MSRGGEREGLGGAPVCVRFVFEGDRRAEEPGAAGREVTLLRLTMAVPDVDPFKQGQVLEGVGKFAEDARKSRAAGEGGSASGGNGESWQLSHSSGIVASRRRLAESKRSESPNLFRKLREKPCSCSGFVLGAMKPRNLEVDLTLCLCVSCSSDKFC
jgi:hypothetical protein